MKRFILLTYLFVLFPAVITFGQSLNTQIFKLNKVLGYIDFFYVDSVDTEDIVEGAIVEMLNELDPHSSYLTEEEVKEMREPLEGNFEGIGIQFNVLYDTIFVINPISGGPSEKVGIRAGDRIIKIEGENVAGNGITANQVRERLLGDKGTKVEVSVKRKGVNGLIDFAITRDKIPIYSLDAAYMVNDSIAYLRFNQFSSTTMEEFYDAMEEFSNNFAGLILDLRNNGGGYLKVAIDLADQFLDEDKLIVYTEGLHSSRQDYRANEEGVFEDGKLVLLIDGGSASASEIVSGSVQDWDRGVILGRRSFGKGLVQRPFNLPDGSMLKLTIARYYTPTGRLIQKPYDDGKEAYAKEIYERYQNGEVINPDSILFPDSLKYQTLLNNRIVYGGGGIMPDLYIPVDTSTNSQYYRSLIRQGIFYRFVLNYIDKNRERLISKYPDFSDYEEDFTITRDIETGMIEFAEEEGLEYQQAQYEKAEEDIKLLLKAYIARDLWSDSEYYQIVNAQDEVFLKAVEIMNSNNNYNRLLEHQMFEISSK